MGMFLSGGKDTVSQRWKEILIFHIVMLCQDDRCSFAEEVALEPILNNTVHLRYYCIFWNSCTFGDTLNEVIQGVRPLEDGGTRFEAQRDLDSRYIEEWADHVTIDHEQAILMAREMTWLACSMFIQCCLNAR